MLQYNMSQNQINLLSLLLRMTEVIERYAAAFVFRYEIVVKWAGVS